MLVTVDKAAILKSIPYFHSASAVDLGRLALLTTEHRLSAQQTLLSAKENASIVILNGRIEQSLSKAACITFPLPSGQLGQILLPHLLFGDIKDREDIFCQTDTHFLRIEQRAFHSLMHSRADFTTSVLRYFADHYFT